MPTELLYAGIGLRPPFTEAQDSGRTDAVPSGKKTRHRIFLARV
ncbi:MAG: hypothetical protein ACFN4Q_08735 [Rothia dentocariosa]